MLIGKLALKCLLMVGSLLKASMDANISGGSATRDAG